MGTNIDGIWNFDCDVIMEALPLIVPNLGDPFTFDADIIVNPETLDGTLIPFQTENFLFNGSGSGLLGDMNPGAANIQLEAEDWIFSQDVPGSFSGTNQPGDIFADGVLRFNFPTLPLDSQSSTADCVGNKTGE